MIKLILIAFGMVSLFFTGFLGCIVVIVLWNLIDGDFPL